MFLQRWCTGSAVALTITVVVVLPSPARADRAESRVLVAQANSAVRSASQTPAGAMNAASVATTTTSEVYSYDPSGRRDPFAALIQGKKKGQSKKNLPPLQRVGLTEINLIGIIWGGFGYTAMVQTPDGKGYSLRRGTRIGPNNGVVTKITKNGIVVTERYTDIYGKEEEREHVKLLHTSEESE